MNGFKRLYSYIVSSVRDFIYYAVDRLPMIKKGAHLYYWRNTDNLGDYLSLVVFEWMLKRKNIKPDDKTLKPFYLMGIGSILSMRFFDATVWGSGILSEYRIQDIKKKSRYRKFNIKAVRGPLSRAILIDSGYDCPECYGDPGILMPLIYYPDVEKQKDYIYIPHHSNVKKTCFADNNSNVEILSIDTKDYKFFINKLLGAKKVISESLHGIILAESYGIPTVFFNNGLDYQLLKYYDWYLSTGRKDMVVASTFEEALKLEPMKLPQLDKMRKSLIDSFPYEFWIKG